MTSKRKLALRRQELPPAQRSDVWLFGIAGALIAAIGVLVIVVVMCLSAPKAKADPIKTPLDLVLSIHKRMYPSQYVKAPEEPPPAQRPKRGFKKAPPPAVESPQPEAAPRVTPAPPRAKVKAKPKPRPAPRQARVVVVRPTAGVSARDCARLRAAYARYGNLINMGGQGYSPADVAFARRACRV